MSPKEDHFDWVSARQDCSLVSRFAELKNMPRRMQRKRGSSLKPKRTASRSFPRTGTDALCTLLRSITSA